MSERKRALIDDYCKHENSLPGLLSIRLETVDDRRLTGYMDVEPYCLNPAHTACHAASIVALADTVCGWGCVSHLPQRAHSFTTLELSCNLLRAVTAGRIACEATMLHGGRTTQVWDAVLSDTAGRAVAAFRCTELILYP